MWRRESIDRPSHVLLEETNEEKRRQDGFKVVSSRRKEDETNAISSAEGVRASTCSVVPPWRRFRPRRPNQVLVSFFCGATTKKGRSLISKTARAKSSRREESEGGRTFTKLSQSSHSSFWTTC